MNLHKFNHLPKKVNIFFIALGLYLIGRVLLKGMVAQEDIDYLIIIGGMYFGLQIIGCIEDWIRRRRQHKMDH